MMRIYIKIVNIGCEEHLPHIKGWRLLFNKLWMKLVIVFGAAGLLITAITAFRIWSFGSQVEYQKADAAIVLGAAVWNGQPSPVLRERVDHALWLYKNGYVDKLIFTGGRGGGEKTAESEAARDYAIKKNVQADDILIETESAITEENLQYAYELAKEKKLKTFALVSDPLHMKRAMLLAETIGISAYSSPAQTSAYQTINSQIPFLCREVFLYIGYVVSRPLEDIKRRMKVVF